MVRFKLIGDKKRPAFYLPVFMHLNSRPEDIKNPMIAHWIFHHNGDRKRRIRINLICTRLANSFPV